MINIFILRIIKIKKILYNIIEYVFDKIENKSNVILNNGETLISLLVLIFFSGIYLFLFYNIYNPYDSIQNIQFKIKIGNIIRNIHYNCSIVCFFLCIIHTLKMISAMKFNKNSVISWTSGLFLVIFLLVCIESGIILINDKNSQTLLIIFAKIIEKIKIFKNTILRIFSGEELLDNSFFFIILFLHIFITLIILIITCLHTVKIKFITTKKITLLSVKLFIMFFLISVVFENLINEKNNIISLSDSINNINLFNIFLIKIYENKFLVYFFIFSIFLIIPFFVKIIFYITFNLNYNNKFYNKDFKKCTKCMRCLTGCLNESVNFNNDVIEINKNCESCGFCLNSCQIKTIKNNKIIKIIKHLKNNKNIFLTCDKKKKTFEKKISEKKNIELYNKENLEMIKKNIIKKIIQLESKIFIFPCEEQCFNFSINNSIKNELLINKIKTKKIIIKKNE